MGRFRHVRGSAKPGVRVGDPTAVPVPNATETGRTRLGFSVNAEINGKGRAGTWHVEYGATSSYGSSTTPRPLPPKLAAYYRETFDDDLNGWRGSATGLALTHQAEGFVRYTDDASSGHDYNHTDGIGLVHLPLYLHTGWVDGGFGLPRLGGNNPDFRNARITMRIKSPGWTANGCYLSTWIQADNFPELVNTGLIADVANWAMTSRDFTSDVVAASDWTTVAWTLRNRTQDWTYAGKNAAQDESLGERYLYGELDARLGNVNVDIFPFMAIDVDVGTPPVGSIDFDDFQIVYRQRSLCAASNGGSLVSEPAGGSGAEYLTDGWRNGAGREWLSEEDPATPQVFVYAFADPVTIFNLQIHNSVEWPSRAVTVEVSEDGETWTEILDDELPESSADGPNFVFVHRELYVIVGDDPVWEPLYPDPVTYMRVTVSTGWQTERWGLGEIEAFGTGASMLTDRAWEDLNQDVEVASGTYHYRVVVETDKGTAYGPDQTVVVP